MHSKYGKVVCTLITFSFLVHTHAIDGGDIAHACAYCFSSLCDAHLPPLPELLKTIGLVTGITIMICSIRQLPKIIFELERKEIARQKQPLYLPKTLHERLTLKCFLQKTIKQELKERKKLLEWDEEQEDKKDYIFNRFQPSLEEKLYDSSIDTGCLILNLPISGKKTTPQEG